MKKLACLIPAVLCIWSFGQAQKEARTFAGHPFFDLKLQLGERIGNIFSRTISCQSDSFPEQVFRISGTGIYTVTDTCAASPAFDGVFRYDGRPESHSKVKVSGGGKNVSYDGQASINTDGSGVMYNSLIWGIPPAKIRVGDTWLVSIPQAWELGGAGVQTITVMEIDAVNNTIRLKREGSGEGYFDNDARQMEIVKDGKKVRMDIQPGTAHWVGYTSFKNGLVVSDELMVTRPLTLTSGEVRYEAMQRQYILLNAMPG